MAGMGRCFPPAGQVPVPRSCVPRALCFLIAVPSFRLQIRTVRWSERRDQSFTLCITSGRSKPDAISNGWEWSSGGMAPRGKAPLSSGWGRGMVWDFFADLTICSPGWRPWYLLSYGRGGPFTWLGGGSVGTSYFLLLCFYLRSAECSIASVCVPACLAIVIR